MEISDLPFNKELDAPRLLTGTLICFVSAQ